MKSFLSLFLAICGTSITSNVLATAPLAGVEVYENIAYTDPEPASTLGNLLDLYIPQFPGNGNGRKHPLVIWSTGCAWACDNGKEEADAVAEAMNPRGYAVAGVSVRSYFTTTFPGQLLDIRKAIRWLRVNADTYGIDPDQMSIIGSSSGGWLAAMAGVTSDIDVLTAQGEDDTDGVSSAVKASVPFFPPVDFLQMDSWYEENPSVPSFIVHNSPLEPIEGDYYPDPLNSFASLASFEALFGDDRLDFTLGGEFGCIFCEGVVGGDPSAVGEGLDGVC